MNLTSPSTVDPLDDARELINRLLDNELSPEQATRLEMMVCEHEDVRRLYVLNMHLWCNLAPHFTSTSAAETPDIKQLEVEQSMVLPAIRGGHAYDAFNDDEPEPIELPPLVWPVKQLPNPWRRRVVGLSAVAASVLVLLLVGVLFWSRPAELATKPSNGNGSSPTTQKNGSTIDEVPAPPPITATVSGSVAATWAPPFGALAPGFRLPDQPVQLTAGVAEIKFDNGVVMIIEAPAKLQVESDMRINLMRGKVVATVPPAANGFAIDTASMNVVDRGTEFGVEVSEAGTTRVEVFQGKVEAGAASSPATTQNSTTPPAPPKQLIAGEAVRAERGATSVSADTVKPLGFVRSEEFEIREASQNGSTYHRWLAYTYHVRRDPSLALYYTFTKQSGTPDRMTNRTVRQDAKRFDMPVGYENAPADTQPKWVQGRWPQKGALDFKRDQKTGALLPEFPFSTNGTLTVTAWVNARTLPQWGAIAKNRGNTDKTFGQFSLGLYEKSGTLVGRVLQADGTESIISESGSPLPTGTWVHVAMVVDGEQLHLYRDGVHAASVECKGMTTTPNPKSLALGFRAGPNNQPTELSGGEHWDGLIDELAIFHRPLTAKEIRDLYEAGRPAN